MEHDSNIKTLEQQMETFINPSPVPKKEQSPTKLTRAHLKVGDKYKITGGKYKKYKVGTLVSINDTYSDVCIDSTEYKKGTMAPLNTLHSKVKNCYLLPFEGKTIEMPEAKDLFVVQDLDKYLEENPIHIPPLEKKEPEPEDTSPPEGTLEVSDTGEVVDNITDVLPSIDEALALRKENKQLQEDLDTLKSSLVPPTPEIGHMGRKIDVYTKVAEKLFAENEEHKKSCCYLLASGGKSELVWKLQAIRKILE
jgi:hypothetical protein